MDQLNIKKQTLSIIKLEFFVTNFNKVVNMIKQKQ